MSLRSRVRQSEFQSTVEEAMVSLLVASGHVRRALRDVCGEYGLTHDQYNVLRILRGVHPEGHPRYEIADRLIEKAPDVTRLLDRLESRGLVERIRSDEDRRLSISRITREGLDLLREVDPAILEVHERFAGGLSERDRTSLAGLCEALIP